MPVWFWLEWWKLWHQQQWVWIQPMYEWRNLQGHDQRICLHLSNGFHRSVFVLLCECTCFGLSSKPHLPPCHLTVDLQFKLNCVWYIVHSNCRPKLPDQHQWMCLQPLPQPRDVHWRCRRLQVQLHPALHGYENIIENIWYAYVLAWCSGISLLWGQFPQPMHLKSLGKEEKRVTDEITVE